MVLQKRGFLQANKGKNQHNKGKPGEKGLFNKKSERAEGKEKRLLRGNRKKDF